MKAGELNKAEDVLDVVLPSGDEAAEVADPGEEPFHFPAPTIAAELSSFLRLVPRCRLEAISSMSYSCASRWSSASESQALSPMICSCPKREYQNETIHNRDIVVSTKLLPDLCL